MLKNKKVLIIGGTSGFGFEVAKGVLQLGGQVVIVGYQQVRLDAAVEELEKYLTNISGVAFDATDQNELQTFVERYAPFDHVISTLGGAMSGGFLEASLATIRDTIEGKLFTNLMVAQQVIPHINQGGSLIFTSGTGGHPANASGAIIGNQAINTMVQGLAIEAAPRVRVNAVAPTWTPTGLWRGLGEQELQTQIDQVGQATPLKRVAAPAEVASGYLYLMQNEFITGEVLKIDGGTNAL